MCEMTSRTRQPVQSDGVSHCSSVSESASAARSATWSASSCLSSAILNPPRSGAIPPQTGAKCGQLRRIRGAPATRRSETQFARDQHALDLTRALTDLEDFGVAPVARDRELVHEAV